MERNDHRLILAGAAAHIDKAATSLANGWSAENDSDFFMAIIEFTKSLREALDIANAAAQEAGRKLNQDQQ